MGNLECDENGNAMCDCYMAKYFVVSSSVRMIHDKVFFGFKQCVNGT